MSTEQKYTNGEAPTTSFDESTKESLERQVLSDSPSSTGPVAPEGAGFISLNLHISSGIGNSDVMHVYRALRDYKRNMFKYLLRHHSEAAATDGDYSDAVSMWQEIEGIEELQNELALQVFDLAETNYSQLAYLKSPDRYADTVVSDKERREKQYSDYLKEFEVDTIK